MLIHQTICFCFLVVACAVWCVIWLEKSKYAFCRIWTVEMLYSNTELIGLLFDVYIYEYFNTSNNTHLTEAYYFVSQR